MTRSNSLFNVPAVRVQSCDVKPYGVEAEVDDTFTQNGLETFCTRGERPCLAPRCLRRPVRDASQLEITDPFAICILVADPAEIWKGMF